MTLKTYIHNNESVEELAEKIGVSRATVYRYLNGTTIPEPPVMRKLIDHTKAFVTPNTFYEKELSKFVRPPPS